MRTVVPMGALIQVAFELALGSLTVGFHPDLRTLPRIVTREGMSKVSCSGIMT